MMSKLPIIGANERQKSVNPGMYNTSSETWYLF